MKRSKIKNVERTAIVLGEEVVIRVRRTTPPAINRGGAIDTDKRRYSRKDKHKNCNQDD